MRVAKAVGNPYINSISIFSRACNTIEQRVVLAYFVCNAVISRGIMLEILVEVVNTGIEGNIFP